MNFIKYQQEVVKEVLKHNSKSRIMCWKEQTKSTEEPKVYCTLDGFLLMCIPEKSWILDVDKIKEEQGITTDPSSNSLINFDDRIDAILSNEKRDEVNVHTKKKRSLVKIKAVGDDTKYTWVDEKLLKYFDNPTFTLSKERMDIKGVNVYEGDEFVGMVMPIRVPEI